MAELDKCIRLAKNDLQSQKLRHPLAPINVEEVSPRQTIPSSSLIREKKDLELAENSAIVEGQISLPCEEEKDGIDLQRNSPITDDASSVNKLPSEQHQESGEKREQGREKLLSEPLLEVQNRSKEARNGVCYLVKWYPMAMKFQYWQRSG